MVNYCLSIENKRGEFKEVDWSRMDRFSSLSSHLLKNIDLFTSSFDDEEHLKTELIKNGILNLEDLNKRIVIRYKSKGVMKNLSYGLAYSMDKKFLDVVYLTYYIKSKKNDLAFLEKLCNHYRNSYIQGNNILFIRDYINKIRQGTIIFEEEKELDKIIAEFVIRECYSYDQKSYTYKVSSSGEPVIKYKGLHDLGLFLAYDARQKCKIIEENNNQNTSLKESTFKEEKGKVKVKTKSDDYKQITIFEYLESKNQN